jgi:hypothetical protein
MSTWKEILRAFSQPAEAPPKEGPAASRSKHAGEAAHPPANWRPPTPAVPYPTTPQTGVLGGRIDAINCGGYSLSYFAYNMGCQLILAASSRDQRVSAQYELAGLPVNQWFRLIESRGLALPVAVCWTGSDLRVRVESEALPQGLPTLTPNHP